MRLRKYKYYFKKPRSEIAKDVLYWLLVAGAVYVTAGSPNFVPRLIRSYKKWQKYSKDKVYDTFYRLRRRGLIEIRREGTQLHISLTPEGKKKAGYFQINDLKINRPQKWDGQWRIVIFDIAELKKIHREAFRGKLKELGFQLLQKSVWVHPFDCRAEIDLLRSFFGLSEEELRLIVSEEIGPLGHLKERFSL